MASAPILQFRPFAPEIVRFKSDAAVVRLTAVIARAAQPSGAASGQATNTQAPTAGNYTGTPASGSKFVGVALADVVAADLTQRPRRGLKPSDQVVGEVFPLSDFCEVLLPITSIVGTPSPEAPAYMGADSKFAVVNPNSSLPQVGTWKTAPDANGRALILIRAANL